MILAPRVLLLLAALTLPLGGAGAQGTPGASEPAKPQAVVEMRGSGMISVPPDMASVSLAVVTRGESAGAAMDRNAAEAARLIAYCATFGLVREKIRTGTVRVAQRQRASGEGRAPIPAEEGYEAVNSVIVTFTDLPRLGGFLRGILENGANRLGGVEFGLTDRDGAADRARSAAFADAHRKAQLFAGLGGLKLGPVLRITYPPRAGGNRMSESAFDLAAPSDGAVPVEPGTIDLEASVEVVWSAQ